MQIIHTDTGSIVYIVTDGVINPPKSKGVPLSEYSLDEISDIIDYLYDAYQSASSKNKKSLAVKYTEVVQHYHSRSENHVYKTHLE